jgi:hypothetical protein
MRKTTFDSALVALTKFRAVYYNPAATPGIDLAIDSQDAGQALGFVAKDYATTETDIEVILSGACYIDVGGTLNYGDEFTIDANGKATPVTNPDDIVWGRYDLPVMSSDEPRQLTSGQTAWLTVYEDKRRAGSNAATGLRVIDFEYDFDDDGGAISDIDLGVEVPAEFVCLFSQYEVYTTFTSATDAATIALTAGPAAAVQATVMAATAISAATDYDDGFHDGDHDWAAANAEKTATAVNMFASIAVEAVTAGKLRGKLIGMVNAE